MAIYGWFQSDGPTGYGYNSTAEQVTDGLDLSGKTYLITGMNSGLGYETVRVLGLRGAKVIGLARTEDKAANAFSELGIDGVPVACELSEPDSVRQAVATVLDGGHTLDGIIANAGIMTLPQCTVQHGLELQFLTNHVGHFMLVNGLVDQLTDDGRVVVLSSSAHRMSWKEGIRFDDLDCSKEYTPWQSYGQSKLANLLFAVELSKRMPKPGQLVNAVHPGVIVTNLGRYMVPSFLFPLGRLLLQTTAFKNVGQGAATQTYVATHPKMRETGEYFADCNVMKRHPHGHDEQMASQLWAKTEEIVAGF